MEFFNNSNRLLFRMSRNETITFLFKIKSFKVLESENFYLTNFFELIRVISHRENTVLRNMQ
ncbi:hypothetical protein LEP1GSC132_2181 [Leptospira kirschneri str. 200803703]|nr:hypothetical protein LEP1GSC132_2181 [Leptospira kirschneri str. 200803703]